MSESCRVLLRHPDYYSYPQASCVLAGLRRLDMYVLAYPAVRSLSLIREFHDVSVHNVSNAYDLCSMTFSQTPFKVLWRVRG